MNTYAHLYVLDNDEEFFKNDLTSLKYIKGEESNVLGLYTGNNINIISHMFTIPNTPVLTIIGGDYSNKMLRMISLIS